MSERSASISRDTLETQISVTINLDGSGKSNFDTGIPFLEHMLEQIARHGCFDIDVISKGAAQSWQMENRYETMLDRKFDYGFAVDWMRKDLGIVLDEANRNNTSLPVTALVNQFYADVQELGGQRWDTSSLLARLPDRRKQGS